MKILFCDNSLRELINFRGDVIEYFSNKGNQIVLVAPNNLSEPLNLKNTIVYDSKLQRRGMNPVKDILYLNNLLRIYKKEKPDVVFHYTIKPNIYGSIAAKILGIPSCAIIAGLGYTFNHRGFKTAIAKTLYRFSMKFPKKILVLNEYNLSELKKNKIVRKNNVIILKGGEGINLDKFK